MFKGRTRETKKKLFRSIVIALDSNGLSPYKNILITLNEQPTENWGVRGGIPADEADLGFKIDV